MNTQSSYQTLLETSHRVNWRVDDLIGSDKRLNFTKPFLPERYARTNGIAYLNDSERLSLNHIRAHGYFALFELVEGFIVAFARDQSKIDDEDPFRASAYDNFSDEEVKHQTLFRRAREDFSAGFGTECAVIGPADTICDAILGHDPLAVTILTLGLEWMSQGHYVESIKDNADLDPVFKNVLKHHWIEEVQHAKLDALLLQSMARARDTRSIARAMDDFFKLTAFLDGGLKGQAGLDLETLEKHIGRTLAPADRETFLTTQHQAWRWTILGSAMSNRHFIASLDVLGGDLPKRISDAARAYC
jgi:hypothetical protein